MKNINLLLLTLILGGGFFFGGAIIDAGSAKAGFQWIPPETPQDTGSSAIISGQTPQTQQLTPIAPGQEPELLITSPVTAKKAPEPSAPPPAAAPEENVRGFADNIPLTVALRQVLPPDYSYSVEKNVDLSALVSWQGGKPWRAIMGEMLKNAGLAMTEQGKAIRVVRAQDKIPEGMTMAPPAAVLAPAAPASKEASPIVMSEQKAPVEILPVPEAVIDGPQAQLPGISVWTANRGDMLHKVLDNWATIAGVDLSWQADYDYPLQASVTLTGTFEEAVRGILSGFQEAQPQPIANLYKGTNSGRAALVIQTRGNNYGD